MFLIYGILIAFICAAANHLGLVAAIEAVIRHKLPIINCPKCSTFWLTYIVNFVMMDYSSGTDPVLRAVIPGAACALASSYLAIWMELLMGYVDVLYNKVYEQIYSTADTATDNTSGADGNLSGVWADTYSE